MDGFCTCSSTANLWLFVTESSDITGGRRYFLRRGPDQANWLAFGDENTIGACFSHDGRYLAWGSKNGAITVVNLPELRTAVQRFEGDE
jgi:hypothetical protein